MKRSVVVLLVSLALIILVSPGIVGRLAERNIEESMDWVERESTDLTITREAFDRGWFTTEGRHRIELKGDLRARVRSLAGQERDDIVPALILDTRIDHGLVPVTSMARESGSLAPGLASTISTLQLDLGGGELVDIPGTLYSQVGLTGATASRYLLPKGSFEDEGTIAAWTGADVSFTASASRRDLGYEGIIEPASLDADGTRLELGKTTFEGSSRQTEYGFMVGDVKLDIDSLSVTGDQGEEVDIGRLTFDGSSDVAKDRVNARATLSVSDFTMPGVGDTALAMDIAVSGIDARSLQAIVAELQHARRQADQDAALAGFYPRIRDELETLLAAGGGLRFDRFDVTLPQGEVTTRLSLALPETDDDDADFSWAAIILALTASADVSLPVALMEMAQAVNPQAGALVAMGILRQEGDSYIVNARYEKGLLTVNGAPMPIPLPGR